MVDYSARAYEQEKYNIYTKGEYAVKPDTAVYMGRPIALYTGIDDATNAFSTGLDTKVWVKPYDDATSIEKSIGVARQNWYESGNTYNDRAGMGGGREEFGFVIDGVLEMKYVSGVGKTSPGRWISPHPSGYVPYTTGMAYLGYELEPGKEATTGFVRVKVEPKYSRTDYE